MMGCTMFAHGGVYHVSLHSLYALRIERKTIPLTAQDAVNLVRSIEAVDTDELLDKLSVMFVDAPPETLYRIDALLHRVADPLGIEAFALTCIYTAIKSSSDPEHDCVVGGDVGTY